LLLFCLPSCPVDLLDLSIKFFSEIASAHIPKPFTYIIFPQIYDAIVCADGICGGRNFVACFQNNRTYQLLKILQIRFCRGIAQDTDTDFTVAVCGKDGTYLY